eukprot:8772406-Pyramimonas_sp.AAC.1
MQCKNAETLIEGLEKRALAREEFATKAQKQETDLGAGFSRREVERTAGARDWLAGWNRLTRNGQA